VRFRFEFVGNHLFKNILQFNQSNRNTFIDESFTIDTRRVAGASEKIHNVQLNSLQLYRHLTIYQLFIRGVDQAEPLAMFMNTDLVVKNLNRNVFLWKYLRTPREQFSLLLKQTVEDSNGVVRDLPMNDIPPLIIRLLTK